MQIPKRKPGKYALVKNDPFLTQEKFDELTDKMLKLKAKRPSAAAEVSRLAEFGDFSENVEYQLAKGRLRGINNKIFELEQTLKNAQIINSSNTDSVQIGNTVTLEVNGGSKEYLILGSVEAEPVKGIISHLSPLGSLLINKKIGDIIELRLTGKVVKYKILKIK